MRLKRSTSVSTSNSLSDCDSSLDLDEDDEVGNGRYSPQSKRRKSTLIWESSPKRRKSDRVRPLLQVEPVVTGKEALISDKNNELISKKSVKEDVDLQLKRSSTSSNNSRSSTDDKLPSDRPWALEDFVLGKALGKVALTQMKLLTSLIPACHGYNLTYPYLDI